MKILDRYPWISQKEIVCFPFDDHAWLFQRRVQVYLNSDRAAWGKKKWSMRKAKGGALDREHISSYGGDGCIRVRINFNGVRSVDVKLFAAYLEH